MIFSRKRFASLLLACSSTLMGLSSGCGGSSSAPDDSGGTSPGGQDASEGGERSGAGGSEAQGAQGGEGATSSTGAQGGTDPSMAGNDAGGVDPGPSCKTATFVTDCPTLECQLVSGCEQGICQYTPLKVCVNRLAKGTFVAGIVDVTVGELTLHGNLSPARFQDGPVCQGTTCLTGGIAP